MRMRNLMKATFLALSLLPFVLVAGNLPALAAAPQVRTQGPGFYRIMLGEGCCTSRQNSGGALTQRFGIRKLSAAGAFLALAGTLPLVWLVVVQTF
jgi:hypothetical protein